MEPVRIAEVSRRMESLRQKTFGPFPRWVCAEENLKENINDKLIFGIREKS